MNNATAMQKLIEYLEQNMESAENKYSKGALRVAIRKAKELLPEEKEQIIAACDIWATFDPLDGESYYNITYNYKEN